MRILAILLLCIGAMASNHRHSLYSIDNEFPPQYDEQDSIAQRDSITQQDSIKPQRPTSFTRLESGQFDEELVDLPDLADGKSPNTKVTHPPQQQQERTRETFLDNAVPFDFDAPDTRNNADSSPAKNKDKREPKLTRTQQQQLDADRAHNAYFAGKNKKVKFISPAKNMPGVIVGNEDLQIELCIQEIEKLPRLLNVAVHMYRGAFKRALLKSHTQIYKDKLQLLTSSSTGKDGGKCKGQMYSLPLSLRGMPLVDGQYFVRISRDSRVGQISLAISPNFKVAKVGAAARVPKDLQVVESISVQGDECEAMELNVELSATIPLQNDAQVKVLNVGNGKSEPALVSSEDDGEEVEWIFDKDDLVSGQQFVTQQFRVPVKDAKLHGQQYMVEIVGKKGNVLIYRSAPFKCV